MCVKSKSKSNCECVCVCCVCVCVKKSKFGFDPGAAPACRAYFLNLRGCRMVIFCIVPKIKPVGVQQ